MKNKVLGKTLALSATFFAVTAFTTTANMAYAQEGRSKFSVDFGGGNVSPNNGNGAVSGPGLPPSNTVEIKSSNTIAATIHYHQSENIDYQLYLAPPIEFDIYAAGSLQGAGHLSTVDVLLPTAMVNYTFTNFGPFKPYVGAGLNYTIFSHEKSTATANGLLGGDTDIKLDNSFGVAVQVGLKVDLNERWYLNANYLWIDVDSKAHIDTGAVGTSRTVDLGIDPSVVYLSIGYRF